MHVLRIIDGPFLVRVTVDRNGRADWVPFTPLQPMLDDIRLLDCAPTRTSIPGVGVKYVNGGYDAHACKLTDRYRLED